MTKEIELTQGKTALVNDEDYEELSKYTWWAHNNRGYTWYARRKEWRDGKYLTIPMHRQIMGAEKDEQVDHINGWGLDNRRENLRLCSLAQNLANSKGRGGSSKYKGVSWHKRDEKWRAYIMKNYNRHFLGYFDDEEAAARAYNEAARELFGEFARLNEIGER